MTATTIDSVLFDLDGTLLDTAPDLAYALTCLCQQEKQDCPPFSDIRSMISEGSPGLIKLAFGLSDTAPEFGALREQFLMHYQNSLHRNTQPFAGIPALLDSLDAAHVPWGIVTNKPGFLAKPLLRHFNWLTRAHVVVYRDSTTQCKPHPAPLKLALQHLKKRAPQCAYLGDSLTDIRAAKSANMPAIFVDYGYGTLPPLNADGLGVQADVVLQQPNDIHPWLSQHTALFQ